ncbi:polyhydroxyalkanoic acid system family protein [Salipiger sp. IMCC34102]|uniref:polyhydroxyalkanoic acid system family protein n=1 Tax=Salipiger sp. IMCC34102 TaxID=2510647 RepID=UPI0013EB34C3|nr:polyhydroxyalkanoic acid system family protein [Salipiger sp. IMCC34102]
MPKVDFTVPHSLPREEATARLLAGVPKLRGKLPPGGTVDARRVGEDGMVLDIGLMGQQVTVDSRLTDTSVDGQVRIPAMMALMKGQIADMVTDAITRMLAKPAA